MSRTFQLAVAVSLAAHLILWLGWRWLGNRPGQIQSAWDGVPPVEMVAVQEDFALKPPVPSVPASSAEPFVSVPESKPLALAPAPKAENLPLLPPRPPMVVETASLEKSARPPAATAVPEKPRSRPEPEPVASPGPAPVADATRGGQEGSIAVPTLVSESATNLGLARPGSMEPAPLVGPVRYRQAREPEYPAPARRRRQEGVVLLEALVAPDGRVRSVRLQRTSGFPLLDQAALKAVAGWEFVVPSNQLWRVEVPVRFQLTR